jgi:hypothetical protein
VSITTVGPSTPFKLRDPEFRKRTRVESKDIMAELRLKAAALMLCGHFAAAAWGYDEKVVSRREYFYVGGEYANLTVSNNKKE